MKKLYTVMIASCLVLAVSGCSTVEGLGKDIQKGGKVLEGAAQKAS